MRSKRTIAVTAKLLSTTWAWTLSDWKKKTKNSPLLLRRSTRSFANWKEENRIKKTNPKLTGKLQELKDHFYSTGKDLDPGFHNTS
jgi:hypothetical protein